MTYDSFCEKLRQYYDGYHFTHNSIGIYNPFSLLNAFKRKEFGSYWFETGDTPTYLVEVAKKTSLQSGTDGTRRDQCPSVE